MSLVGVATTSAISYITKNHGFDLGVMITASHNSYQDNGIKVFLQNGSKLTNEQELEVEELFFGGNFQDINEVGELKMRKNLLESYSKFLISSIDGLSLRGMKIILDCANGSAYQIAPRILQTLGAEIKKIGVNPNGHNINLNCGSQYPEQLRKHVIKLKGDLGIALDGDGDRLILVDEIGNVIDGDHIMGFIAVSLKLDKRLSNNSIVLTKYSNMALEKYLKEMGIATYKVEVGDRFVLQKMKKERLIFGGEPSGHYIFLDYLPTSDGILSTLQVLKILRQKKQKLSELAHAFAKYPQKVFNVKVSKRVPLEQLPSFQKELRSIEKVFGGKGRVFCRYSGTEKLLRIMVEHKDLDQVNQAGKELSQIAEKILN